MSYVSALHPTFELRIADCPVELRRGLHMVRATCGMSIRDWACLVLYRAIDEELSGFPEWRDMSERGEERAYLQAHWKQADAAAVRAIREARIKRAAVRKAGGLPTKEPIERPQKASDEPK